MNQEVANAVSGYIQTLYRMNQKCILLCGADLFNGPDYTVPALELVCDIPRVVPYKYSEEKGILISVNCNSNLNSKLSLRSVNLDN